MSVRPPPRARHCRRRPSRCQGRRRTRRRSCSARPRRRGRPPRRTPHAGQLNVLLLPSAACQKPHRVHVFDVPGSVVMRTCRPACRAAADCSRSQKAPCDIVSILRTVFECSTRPLRSDSAAVCRCGCTNKRVRVSRPCDQQRHVRAAALGRAAPRPRPLRRGDEAAGRVRVPRDQQGAGGGARAARVLRGGAARGRDRGRRVRRRAVRATRSGAPLCMGSGRASTC